MPALETARRIANRLYFLYRLFSWFSPPLIHRGHSVSHLQGYLCECPRFIPFWMLHLLTACAKIPFDMKKAMNGLPPIVGTGTERTGCWKGSLFDGRPSPGSCPLKPHTGGRAGRVTPLRVSSALSGELRVVPRKHSFRPHGDGGSFYCL